MVSAETLLEEERFFFSHEGCRLVGMLHRPSSALRAGVILLHGWAGYRAGPHQMFIKLARRAAEAGLACLRFDFRGRGDSEGDPAAASLSTMISDTLRAAEVLVERCGELPLALVGDCSGSEVALGAGLLIPGCERLVLWSAPPVGGERQEMRQAKRRRLLQQYLRKAVSLRTWRRLLQREVRLDMVTKALRSGGLGAGELGQDSDREIDWFQRFRDFQGRMLFIYGSNDPATPASLEHYQYLTAQAGRPWEVHLVEGANHAFYSLAWEREVLDVGLNWLDEWAVESRSGHG